MAEAEGVAETRPRYRTLSQRASVLHDVEQLRLTIVFDGRGAELVIERPLGHATLTHLYTPTGTTADDVIEQLVGNTADASLCLVATDGRTERQTIEALGAAGLSSDELAAIETEPSPTDTDVNLKRRNSGQNKAVRFFQSSRIPD